MSPHSLWLLAGILAIAGIYEGTKESLEDSVAAELIPKEQHGMAFGTLAAVSVKSAFSATALLSFAGAVIILRLRK
jgi:hypothetical protein